MSLRLLDTDILTLYQHSQPNVLARMESVSADERAVTVITVEEQIVGWHALVNRARGAAAIAFAYERLAANVRFLSGLRILSFTEAAIARYEELRRLKLRVGGNDLRIAAIALEHEAIVVTRNVRDFERVPGLTIENWAD